MLSVIFWDPPRAVIPWNIPFLGRPVLWYGFLFALGFFLAYFLLVHLLKSYFDRDHLLEKKENKQRARILAEKALLYSVVGTIVGARLGDVLFYQSWQITLSDPLSIFRIWEGGLASHGGAVGVLIAFWLLFRKVKQEYPTLSFAGLLDLFCIPISIVAGFICLGNFFNQEILGTPTTLPWATVFGHPADGSIPVPRHPVQIYESLWYFIVGVFLYFLWKKDPSLRRQGKITGLFLIFVFGFRILIENLKEEQSLWFQSSWMTMGGWLSIPFIALGIVLLWKGRKVRH